MSWNTKITKLLNIDYPIIQGAMAYISDGDERKQEKHKR